MDLTHLNEAQRKAVRTTEGRVLILAGAGSGKTRVLTFRMAYLIQEMGVSPDAILGLTFTNKAANEMRERIRSMIPHKLANRITLSTFHSFCLKILREDIHYLGYTKAFTLWDQSDVERVVKIIARDILGTESELPSLKPTFDQIAKARSDGIKLEDMDQVTWHDEFSRTVYRRLMDAFRAFNALDFDALLSETVRLFETVPDVLEKWSSRFRYVMIDEYQDTNPVQFRLTELLTQKHQNLCVVGDDDQSIYGWRGASIKNILSFQGTESIKLEQNFRSTGTILEAANHVIRKNSQRHDKKLWSHKGEGSKLEIFHAPTDENEAEAVIARLAKMKESMKVGWSHFAILYRSNALSRQFETALMKYSWFDSETWVRGIPYEIFGGTEFYERKEIKDLLAYLKVMVNPKDEASLLRIVNFPRRGIGEGSLDKLTNYNRTHKLPLFEVLKAPPPEIEISPKVTSAIQSFVEMIEEGKTRFENDLTGSMLWLLDQIDYKKAIKEEVKSEKMQAFKWENVEEFVSALKEQEGKGGLVEFLETSLLNKESLKSKDDKKTNKVSLMTFHSSKGLEFPVCFLVGLEDHIIPHEKSALEGGVEEERRLMYVAITRAEEKLVMSMARTRKKMGQEVHSTPSRFLMDIPKELLNVSKWNDLS
ncbi:MAG: UvrD-helicase domain-containing protein [Chlamydiia bacterium]|nr:UvrD-helicase domain-containing protein [Chlamydiia bacterium]